MLTLTMEAAARTDVGLMRRNNQDSFGMDEALGLFVVCDGMGGAAGGEVASRIATDTFLNIARQELNLEKSGTTEVTRRALERGAVAANRAVNQKGNFDHRYRGMGSTMVGVRVMGSTMIAINVGDSRVYLIRNGRANQVTVDHSYVQEQVALGAMTEQEAAVSSMQSLITRAIGAEDDVHPDLFQIALQPRDCVLLTSDGLTRHVEDHEIANMVLDAASADEACRELIGLAKERGGSDNITCIVLRLL